MSNVLQNFLTGDKEQELLQSFIRTGNAVDDEAAEEQTKKKRGRRRRTSFSRPSRERRSSSTLPAPPSMQQTVGKAVKFSDTADNENAAGAAGGGSNKRANRIETELRAARKRTEEQLLKKKNFVDFYTDKDRAAAVSAGAFDIKQSLQLKQKQDRTETLAIPDEADISSIIALGLKEIKNANPDNAIQFFTKVEYLL